MSSGQNSDGQPGELNVEKGYWERQALDYAQALQQGQYDRVIDSTFWMVELLQRVRRREGDVEAVDVQRGTLRQQLALRRDEENQLREEGVRDKYVFAPGARLEVLAMDEGSPNLARPTASRVWIQVTYPSQRSALKDEEGRPVRRIVVGVNLSKEGYVLKAAVVGNLEINRYAISRDWSVL